MSKVTSKWIADSAVESQHMSASAKQSVLESKLMGVRRGVINFTTTAASSDTATTEVEAAASVDVAQTDLVTGEGIYVGAVANATDVKKVLIRQSGTDQGIDDGSGDEVFGKLTEAAGVYTLSYFKADNTAFTFSGATAIDYYFVEIQDYHSLKEDALLYQAVSGVIDADQSTTISGHLDGTANKHDANEIDYERLDGEKKNIDAASDDVEAALSDLDDALGALPASPTNYSPTDAAIAADHLSAIDSAIGALAADTDFADDVFRISDDVDATKKIAFQAAEITTGTVRTVTMPDADVDLGDLVDHLNGAGIKHGADESSYDLADASKNSIQENSDNVELALKDLDDSKQAYMVADLAAVNNITLSGEQTIDGVATLLSTVLVAGNTLPEQNGIYVSGAGAWTRIAKLSKSSQFVAGQHVHVLGGSAYGDSMWVLQAAVATVDTSAVDFDQVNGVALSSTDAFVGKSNPSDASPTYSSTNFAAGNLEAAIGALDAAFGGDLSFVPTNYADPADNIQAHLQAIDSALGSASSTEFADDVFRIVDDADNTKKIAFQASGIATGTVRNITMPDRDVDLNNIGQWQTESFTLSAGDITNKYVDLAGVPKDASAVQVFPQGGPPQNDGVDFDMITDGSDIKRLSWSALGMDGVLEASDVLRVHYEIAG